MKTLLLVIMSVLLLWSCAAVAPAPIHIPHTYTSGDGNSIVVLIPGIGGNESSMEALQKAIPVRSVIIKPRFYLQLSWAANDLYSQMESLGLTGKKVSFVGHSWGGLIARKFNEKYGNEIVVEKIVQIASPNGVKKNMHWLVRKMFGIDMEESNTPLFIITGDADVVVEVSSALDLNLPKDRKEVLEGAGHVDILRLPKTFELVNSYLSKG